MRGSRLLVLFATTWLACGGVVTSPGGTSSSSGTGGGSSTSTSVTTTTTTVTSTSTGTGPSVCTLGQDQTCNDDPAVSSIWGTCQADGTCLCNPGFEVNPSTGHCRIAKDGGAFDCGGMSCKADEFCIERVHNQDAGPVPSTWMCETYFMCMEHTCPCAIQNFVSASCISPKCVSEDPVWIRCDDLN